MKIFSIGSEKSVGHVNLSIAPVPDDAVLALLARLKMNCLGEAPAGGSAKYPTLECYIS